MKFFYKIKLFILKNINFNIFTFDFISKNRAKYTYLQKMTTFISNKWLIFKKNHIENKIVLYFINSFQIKYLKWFFYYKMSFKSRNTKCLVRHFQLKWQF